MTPDAQLTVVYRPLAGLIPYARNARTHSDEQVAQIAASIQAFGWTNPILVDEFGGVIAGHGRIMAAQTLGMADVPTICLPGLTEAQRRALVLTDNKLALNAGWDFGLLRDELAELDTGEFDMSVIGFSDDELEQIATWTPDGLKQGNTDPDEAPSAPSVPVSRIGDLWILGGHRLLCGDARSEDGLALLMAGEAADIANCDPPYGISAVKGGTIGGAKPFGNVGGGGMTRFGRVHGRAKNAIIEPGVYAPIIGDDTTDTAVAGYQAIVALNVPVIVMWGGNYYANELPPSRCWLVWDKETNGNFADAELAWTNQDRVVELFRHQWSGLIKASERGERRTHPTQKPVALAQWVIETLAPNAEVATDRGGVMVAA